MKYMQSIIKTNYITYKLIRNISKTLKYCSFLWFKKPSIKIQNISVKRTWSFPISLCPHELNKDRDTSSMSLPNNRPRQPTIQAHPWWPPRSRDTSGQSSGLPAADLPVVMATVPPTAHGRSGGGKRHTQS